MPLKEGLNTALGYNHQSTCMPQLGTILLIIIVNNCVIIVNYFQLKQKSSSRVTLFKLVESRRFTICHTRTLHQSNQLNEYVQSWINGMVCIICIFQ